MLTYGAIAVIVTIAVFSIGLAIIEYRSEKEVERKREALRKRAQEDALAIQRNADTRKIETRILDDLEDRELRGVNTWLRESYRE